MTAWASHGDQIERSEAITSSGSCNEKAAADGGEVKTMDQAEREAIETALRKCDGNRTKTAGTLGISRRALIYKIKNKDKIMNKK